MHVFFNVERFYLRFFFENINTKFIYTKGSFKVFKKNIFKDHSNMIIVASRFESHETLLYFMDDFDEIPNPKRTVYDNQTSYDFKHVSHTRMGFFA